MQGNNQCSLIQINVSFTSFNEIPKSRLLGNFVYLKKQLEENVSIDFSFPFLGEKLDYNLIRSDSER